MHQSMCVPRGPPLATQGILTANVLHTQGTLTQISVDRVGMSDKRNAPVSVNQMILTANV